MDLAKYAASYNLRRVGGRPPLREYLGETWHRRRFIWTMAQYHVRSTLEDNRLGILWLLFDPCLNALVYGFIFGIMLGNSRGPDYIPRIVIGVFLWQFFAKSLSDSAKAITGNRALVQSLAFPRLTLPFSKVIEHLISTLPSLALLLIILPIFGFWPKWSWLLIFPLLVLYTLLNLGVSMIAARLTVHLRDVAQLLPYITRILMYSSGVLFNVDTLFSSKSHVGKMVLKAYDFHPLYQVLQLARGAFMGISVNSRYWLYLSVSAVVIFIVGLLFFWSAEERYGRE